MVVEFVGNALSYDGGRVTRGAVLTVGTDIPEEVFERYAHRFRIIRGELPQPQTRVMEPRVKHTGFGWYAVRGVEGKHRKEDALALAEREA
jgi:hypothetical protein